MFVALGMAKSFGGLTLGVLLTLGSTPMLSATKLRMAFLSIRLLTSLVAAD